MRDHLHSTTAIVPVVHMRDGRVMADSRDVAAFFEKRHDHVLRDIDNLVNSLKTLPPLLGTPPFVEIRGEIDRSGSAPRYFEMTQHGFSLLALGFNGDKALKFKLAYIAQFEAMEQVLKDLGAQPVSATERARLDRAAAMRMNAETRIKAQQDKLRLALLASSERNAVKSVTTALIISMARETGLDITLPAPTADEAQTMRISKSAGQISNEFGVSAQFVRGLGKQMIATGELIQGEDWHPDSYAYGGGTNDNCRKYYDSGIEKMRPHLETEAQRPKRGRAA